MVLKIKYASKNVANFAIGTDLFYLRFRPIPQLFDAFLTPMVVPNLDAWIQSKTQQQYSLKELELATSAFYDGLEAAYGLQDFQDACDKATIFCINRIMRCGHLYDYIVYYWIEALSSDKMEKHLELIRKNFDSIRKQLGDDKFHNDLCRILAICRIRKSHNADVCEQLIKRLERDPADPHYPNTANINKEIMAATRVVLLQYVTNEYKNVPNEIKKTVDALERQA